MVHYLKVKEAKFEEGLMLLVVEKNSRWARLRVNFPVVLIPAGMNFQAPATVVAVMVVVLKGTMEVGTDRVLVKLNS